MRVLDFRLKLDLVLFLVKRVEDFRLKLGASKWVVFKIWQIPSDKFSSWMFSPFSLVPPRSQSLSGFPSFHLSLPPPSNSLFFCHCQCQSGKRREKEYVGLDGTGFPPSFCFLRGEGIFEGGKGEEEDGWLGLSAPNFFNKKENYSCFWETKECICLLILYVPVKTRFETSFFLSSVGKNFSAPQKPTSVELPVKSETRFLLFSPTFSCAHSSLHPALRRKGGKPASFLSFPGEHLSGVWKWRGKGRGRRRKRRRKMRWKVTPPKNANAAEKEKEKTPPPPT